MVGDGNTWVGVVGGFYIHFNLRIITNCSIRQDLAAVNQANYVKLITAYFCGFFSKLTEKFREIDIKQQVIGFGVRQMFPQKEPG